MAATTLTEASEAEILKIFKVVAKKSITSVEGMVQATKPKLNALIAETIDAFRDSPRNVEKTMDTLILRMKELGMSVDDLSGDMKKLPKGFESLQNALRAKEQNRILVEKQVEDLRSKGIAAEIVNNKVKIITQKEMKTREERWAKTQEIINNRHTEVLKATKELESITNKTDRAKKEEFIIKEREKIVEAETKLANKKEQAKGKTAEEGGGMGQGDMRDSQGILSPLADQFMAIKDSITGPFLEMAELGKRIGVSFKNFGKAMLTPIKSLKLFGANLMLSIVPLMLKTLAFLAVVAIITAIIFKFADIKDKLTEWWDQMSQTLANWWQSMKELGTRLMEWVTNIPKMLGEAVGNAVDWMAGIKDKILNGIKGAIESATDFIVDGFYSIINAPIKLLNKIPGINIPLLGGEGAAAAEASSVTADQIVAEPSKVQMDKDESKWYKPWTWNKDDDEIAEVMKTEAVAPVGAGNNVIVQDNKTISNTQSNAETSMVAKADKNPEPSSFWDKISFWN